MLDELKHEAKTSNPGFDEQVIHDIDEMAYR